MSNQHRLVIRKMVVRKECNSMCTSLRPAVSLTTQCACSGVRHHQARHQLDQWRLLPSLWRSPRLRLQWAATTAQMWACCCSPFWPGWRAFWGVSLLETAPRPQEALQDSLVDLFQYQPYGQHETIVEPGYLFMEMVSLYQHRWRRFAVASCMQGNQDSQKAVMQQQEQQPNL